MSQNRPNINMICVRHTEGSTQEKRPKRWTRQDSWVRRPEPRSGVRRGTCSPPEPPGGPSLPTPGSQTSDFDAVRVSFLFTPPSLCHFCLTVYSEAGSLETGPQA